ncbi:MAG TPA: 50S ribosomal protein L22 [Nitrospirae bacterium]|nr:50S ribosomal protein L22 [bacterium BMS3Abin10]GBE38702.1 50S ribosomal protein L22 [bacterium BMS3Bbin08]HDH51078.1 50S ribosomal protein L22 [Nitrospirota bacterium]HDK41106.1 50S ribosomal protein L22 [Nitrospirota bacterium]HDK82654.1 50S ribosomal protein L22 [Nitrospirota bacterium]
MESKAILKYSRVSPTKVRRLTNLIKGKKAGDALIKLKFLPHSPARIVAKVLKSAMANAEQKKVADPESMKIVGAVVDQGPTMKRMMPRAMGRADIIKKRSSHIKVLLKEEEK